MLDGHPGRVAALAAIDPDWRPDWPIDWQRHYTRLADCLTGGATLTELQPGVTVSGEDIGRWLQRQRQPHTWRALSNPQRERLTALGVQPTQPPQEAVQAAPAGTVEWTGAFGRGLTALHQYAEREGHVRVPRQHTETLPDGTQVRLGVWISNTKSPARRAKLAVDQLAALTQLGLHWT